MSSAGWSRSRPTSYQGEALVNGTPDIIILDEYDFTEADLARPDVRAVLEPLPDGDLFSHRFVRKESTSDGSRFVVVADFARCNACRNEVLAHAEIAYDLDPSGRFHGAKLLRVRSGAAPPTERSPAQLGRKEPRAAAAAIEPWLSARPYAESASPRMADCSCTTKRLPGVLIRLNRRRSIHVRPADAIRSSSLKPPVRMPSFIWSTSKSEGNARSTYQPARSRNGCPGQRTSDSCFWRANASRLRISP